ncbi:MAG: pilus assembly protein N-terminal domain-containing protein, partial [Pseudomonas sp.]|nr:pilus assembly protein N-terminal domain-containing protein [Pseudomonas sp.]
MKNMRRVGALALMLGSLAMLSGLAGAETVPAVRATPAANISDVQVPIYKSRVLTTRTAVKRISVGNPAIADILITSPTQLYLLGRSLGSTNVLLWDGNNRLIDSLDLEVVHDLSGLKGKLHQVLPNEPIEVFSAQGALVLRGQVSNAAAMDSALKLAESYAQQATKDDKQGAPAGAAAEQPMPLINLMSVGGSQQVMLEVKVAEMQRNLFKNLNVRFNALDFGSSGRWSGGGFNNGDGLGFDEDGLVNPTTLFGDGTGIFGQFLSDNFLFNVVLEAAKDNGSAKV